MNPSSPIKILVVEDELIIAADISARLTRLGYEVVGQADHPEEAIRLAGERAPHIVLMDIQLKGNGDGVMVAHQISQRFRIPVVYLTAHADEATLQRAKLAEPFGYVLKPFEERELRTAIEIALYKHVSERRIRESEHRYATTLASIGDGVITTDQNGKVTFLNPIAERLTGWTTVEALGHPLDEIFRVLKESDRSPAENLVEEALRQGHILGIENHKILIARDGREYIINDCATPIRDDAGTIYGLVVVFRDITDQRRKEVELRQAQKMEAIGRLASGIAHDFNNLLTVITGYSAILQDSLESNHPWQEAIEQINGASQRASELTRQLLAFCRRQLVKPRIIDLNKLVNDNLKMLQRLIPSSIQLVTHLPVEPLSIKADLGQIEQVILNLVINARDAMPNGGTVSITTGRGECQHGDAIFPTGGRYVSLQIADTGMGMDQETLAHIWEPFFTTKEVGKGTGLGLATVYGIVNQSQGFITVESQLGQGTRFTITFPEVVHSSASANQSGMASSLPKGHETILLVDDDDAVRNLASLVLRSAGYKVIEASNGVEATELAVRHEEPIHLLLTDLTMPQMSGRTLASIIQTQIPKIRVLIMTGYADVPLLQSQQGRKFEIFLKPFTPASLATRVREVLDQPDKPPSHNSEAPTHNGEVLDYNL
ncbi:MAG: response regulator [Gemmataceae bacterium]|nr:response regulator [Gemmataceae bacterium]